ncbi:hypothetical protein EIP91_005595, partial [Steccherinum ochraceum]
MEKPLPHIPAPTGRPHQSRSFTGLTIEAQEHLRQFISRLLEDEESVSARSEWVTALESALRELGDAVFTKGWLAGLKRAKMLRKVIRRQEGSGQSSGSEKAVSVKKTENDERAVVVPVPSTSGPSSKESPEYRRNILDTLHNLVSRPSSPTPKPRIRHLLLTVALHSAQREENIVFRTSSAKCKFTSGRFFFPPKEMSNDGLESILYGLDEWNVSLADEDALQIVGGTFVFNGVASPEQHDILRKVLRLAVFMYLSMLLEQHVLFDSHVTLRFRKPALTPNGSPALQAGPAVQRALSTPQVGHKPKRDSGSSFWSFLSKKKDDFVRRAADAAPSLVRRGSLDLPLANSPGQPRRSEDSPLRPRRLSIIGDLRSSFLPPPKEEPPPEDPPFKCAMDALKKYESILSTSPGITFRPPPVLVKLVEKEKSDVERRLTGDEKAALTSLLGWTNKAAKGSGMTGTSGFVLQQGLCVLYSESVPVTPPGTSRPTTLANHRTSSSPSIPPVTAPQRTICSGRTGRWLTYRYWGRGALRDECLGDTVIRLCSSACDPCQESKCPWKRGEHEMVWTHGSSRITAITTFDPEADLQDSSDDAVEMWESCQVCDKQSKKESMSDGSYLFSFAKYLELLIYSPSLINLATPPCEHTSLPSRPWAHLDSPLPRMRVNIVRNFAYKGRSISFSLSTVEDVFEVSIPRLRIIRGRPIEKDEDAPQESSLTSEPERRALRREIMKWWQGLSERIDELEANFVPETTSSYHKSLPRLPSASIDDAYDFLDDEDNDDGAVTPKGRPMNLPPHPPNTPQTPRVASGSSASFPFSGNTDDLGSPTTLEALTPSTSAITVTVTGPEPKSDSLQLLSSLRHAFQRTERYLYAELAHTPEDCLNDARRSFHTAAKGATRRLSAWQTKHTPNTRQDSEFSPPEPGWWATGCHAVPGSSVIVRESDWGSIIAFTLSSQDYAHVLTSMSSNRSQTSSPAPPPTPTATPNETRSSFFSKGKWFASSAPLPDPDQEGGVWHEPEEYSAVITRKEHPKDPTSLLMTIPDVLRKTPMDLSSLPAASRFTTFGSNASKSPIPPLARAKAEVQVSRQEADALLSGVSSEGVDKIISDLGAVKDDPRSRRNSASESHTSGTSSSFFEANIRRGKASSILTTDSDISTVGAASSDSHSSAPAPPVPPKTSEHVPNTPGTENDPPATDSTISSNGSSVSETLGNTLSAALRYMVRAGEVPTVPSKHHHGLLSTALPAIDERPHIKYDWTIGKRLKFSCTVYYAKQFDSLRRRCGIEETFLRSMARSENWTAEGGKSRSNFWRTTDNQYIIKTLVNAWNVADLQVLIDLGPSYFRYMDTTATKASVLAKLLGFYTVEIRNLETGNVQSRADLLVMENLFYNQKIGKTFDLKGIQGRKVKAASGGDNAPSKTLFDGEWIEGQQRALTLVHPHSKAILTEAIKLDCEFLAKSNIMDYSLLLGICEERKVIACGLVDAIGSYTFAKTLEYKAKHGLSSSKEVTVVPPAEYQERFVNAMDDYFVACPDKWSRPLDDASVSNDWRKLP